MEPDKPRRQLFFFRQRGELGYLAEISLIILSILFAFWIERIRENWEDKKKLAQYLSEIKIDISEELKTSKMNLYDCENDLRLLNTNLKLATEFQKDSVQKYRNNFLAVFYRGVYRTFSPTTIDVMTNNGDLELLENDSLQKNLVSTFSFRENVKQEFILFDNACSETSSILFTDLNIVNRENIDINPFLVYKDENTKAIFALMRRANYKAFMLQIYIEDLKIMKEQLSKID